MKNYDHFDDRCDFSISKIMLMMIFILMLIFIFISKMMTITMMKIIFAIHCSVLHLSRSQSQDDQFPTTDCPLAHE